VTAAPVRQLAVEATRLARESRGIGRYVRALLPRLLALRPELRVTLFVKPRDVAAMRGGYAAELGGRVAVRPARRMRGASADLFWYPWNIARPAPRRGAVVATVHDIVPVALPDPSPRRWRRNRRWRGLYAETAERATLVIVPSAFTGEELRRRFGVPPERTRVIPEAADDALTPPGDGDAAALARLGVRAPYVLAVGAPEPRKNLEALDRAMPRVVARVPDATLILVGPRHHGGAPVPGAPWKRMVGYVSDAELSALYRGAACLAMPSVYEGFGLPVLEAMQLGTPVVCARRASLPEVGGDAALWVEPDDDAGIADALVRLLADPAARDGMRRAGLARAALFTWDAAARGTLAAFDEAAALGGRPGAAWYRGALRRWLGVGA